jgi:hypothetical protein
MLTPGDGVSMPRRESRRGKGTDFIFYSECRVDFSRSRKAEVGQKQPLTTVENILSPRWTWLPLGSN